MRGTCGRVRDRLPQLVDGTLPGWRAKLVTRHVGRCDDCAVELERQREVARGLEELGRAAVVPDVAPPDDLLESILERAQDPGLRARVAVPVRGAVSGARPGLSVAGLLLVAAVVYLSWRLAREVVRLVEEAAGR